MFLLIPMLATSQEIKELYRIPLANADELRVGVTVESSRKSNGSILGTDGKVYVEDDGTWTGYDHGIQASDKLFVMNKKGDLYIVGRVDDGLGIWASADLGRSWEKTGTFSDTKNNEITFFSVHCDKKAGDLYILYATQTNAGEECVATIWMVNSSNEGKKWTEPLRLNGEDVSCSRVTASMTSFEDGKLWSIWTDYNKFLVDRSYDGKTWLRNDISVLADYKGGMEYGVPRMIMDNSRSKLRGMIYMSGVTPTDSTTIAWVRKSGNLGDSWNGNVPVDASYSGSQYYPALSIDMTVGSLFAVWIGVRGDTTEAYFAHSLDAGQTFKPVVMSEWSTTEIPMDKFGQPIDVAAYEEKILVTWIEIDGEDLVQKTLSYKQKDLFDLGKK